MFAGVLAVAGVSVGAIGGWATSAIAEAAPVALNDLATVITQLRNTIVGLLAGLATLFLTVGGVLILFAAGDPEQVSKGKRALKSAAIGYGLAILAPILVTLLKRVVGAP